MDQASLWLSILMTVAMAALILPGVIRMNHGRVIQHTAIWVAIVLALALFYHIFGPFGAATDTLPANRMQTERPAEGERPKLADDSEPTPLDDTGSFTPPRE